MNILDIFLAITAFYVIRILFDEKYKMRKSIFIIMDVLVTTLLILLIILTMSYLR